MGRSCARGERARAAAPARPPHAAASDVRARSDAPAAASLARPALVRAGGASARFIHTSNSTASRMMHALGDLLPERLHAEEVERVVQHADAAARRSARPTRCRCRRTATCRRSRRPRWRSARTACRRPGPPLRSWPTSSTAASPAHAPGDRVDAELDPPHRRRRRGATPPRCRPPRRRSGRTACASSTNAAERRPAASITSAGTGKPVGQPGHRDAAAAQGVQRVERRDLPARRAGRRDRGSRPARRPSRAARRRARPSSSPA